MTLYGDLDISVIDRMPEGRKPVKTIRKSEKSREDVYALVRERLRQGQQAFIVYPLVEESEKTDLGAAVEQFEFLRERFLPFRVGLLHGKMNADEKNRIMREFRDGGVQLLVTTTVVEVGIDVPAATLMIIEHAERFGLAQLHQLRGRVGRGGLPGLCILMTSAPLSGEAGERLRVMCRSHDGFVIAEKDLEIRGPGDYLGIRQAGIPDFHFGNLVRHGDLLAKARDDVAELFESGGLSRDERERLRESCRGKWSEIAGFFN